MFNTIKNDPGLKKKAIIAAVLLAAILMLMLICAIYNSASGYPMMHRYPGHMYGGYGMNHAGFLHGIVSLMLGIFVLGFITSIVIYLLKSPHKGSLNGMLSAKSRASSCKGCGSTVKSGFAFCPQCGETLKQKCTECGTDMQETWVCCPNCGNKAAQEETAQDGE